MNDLDFKTIGKHIRDRRKALGMTQEFVANSLEVNPSHISNIERGHAKPSLIALVKIANILRCSVDCFLIQEYTYETDNSRTIDDQITEKLKYCDIDKKKKILKIMDLL